MSLGCRNLLLKLSCDYSICSFSEVALLSQNFGMNASGLTVVW